MFGICPQQQELVAGAENEAANGTGQTYPRGSLQLGVFVETYTKYTKYEYTAVNTCCCTAVVGCFFDSSFFSLYVQQYGRAVRCTAKDTGSFRFQYQQQCCTALGWNQVSLRCKLRR